MKSDYFNNRNLAIALLIALVLMFIRIPYFETDSIAKVIVLIVAVILIIRK
ncbi:MAG: hypothetical protein ABIJ18_01385 [archaeon]